MPTDVAPMDNPACRAGGRGRRRPDRGPAGARRAAQRRAHLGAVAAGARTAAPTIPTPGRTSTPPAPRWRSAASPTGSAPCWPCRTCTSSVDVAEALAGQLAEVGIVVEIQKFRPGLLLRDRRRRARRTSPPTATAWCWPPGPRTSPTPAAFLAPLADGRSIQALGNPNYARLNDPGINALVDQARRGGRHLGGHGPVAPGRGRHAGDRWPTCRSPRRGCSSSRDSGCTTVS